MSTVLAGESLVFAIGHSLLDGNDFVEKKERILVVAGRGQGRPQVVQESEAVDEVTRCYEVGESLFVVLDRRLPVAEELMH